MVHINNNKIFKKKKQINEHTISIRGKYLEENKERYDWNYLGWSGKAFLSRHHLSQDLNNKNQTYIIMCKHSKM